MFLFHSFSFFFSLLLLILFFPSFFSF